MKSSSRAGGFTLIEVLVALVIAAMGLGAVLGVITSASRNAIYMRQKMLADWVGQNVLTELRVSGTVPATTTTSGEIEDFAGIKWAWTQTVADAGVPGLLRVEIAVRPAEAPPTDSLATVSGFVGATATTAPSSSTVWDVVTTGAIGSGVGSTTGTTPSVTPMSPPADGSGNGGVTTTSDGTDGTTTLPPGGTTPVPVGPRGSAPQ
jgi:general secretion pathway protein I